MLQRQALPLRTLFTFTPTMTLQTYAQLFFSSVRYGQLLQTTRSDRKPYLYFADLGPSMGNPSDFDTHDAVLNLNAVFRWSTGPAQCSTSSTPALTPVGWRCHSMMGMGSGSRPL